MPRIAFTIFCSFQILILSFITSLPCASQPSASDSTFINSVCTELPYVSYWNKPGTWFTQGEIQSLQDMYDKINTQFIFQNTDYVDCYQNIVLAPYMELDTSINSTINNFEDLTGQVVYGLRNPFVKVPFTLFGKSSFARALLDSTHNNSGHHDVAFLLITGTGSNLIKDITSNSGYHNTNCGVMNFFKSWSDFFVMSVPNEDHRGITFNKKKIAASLGSNSSAPFLINYLNSNGKAYGITRLIETVAMIKFLKTRYKRVFVLGLSTGGKVAHWSSLMAEPDAALISSGYSVLVDNDYNSQMVNAIYFSNLLNTFTKDSLKRRTKEIRTQFLLTLPQNDSPIAQDDINTLATKTYYQDVGHVSFNYEYVNHAFPPCAVMDSFFTRCLLKPKVQIKMDSTICKKDSVRFFVTFTGKPPFEYSVFRDSLFYFSRFCSTPHDTFVLHQEGCFIIDEILDSLNAVGYRSEPFYFQKDPIPGLSITTPEFDCDSVQFKLPLQFQGTPPYQFSFTRDGSLVNFMCHTDSFTVYSDAGIHTQFLMQDSNQCMAYIGDTLNLVAPEANLKIHAVQYRCQDQLSEIHVTANGKFPLQWGCWDSINQQTLLHQINTPTDTIVLPNGWYHFTTVKDSNQCTFLVDTSVTIQEEPLLILWSALAYSCGDSVAKLPISVSGKPPFILKTLTQNDSLFLQLPLHSDTLTIAPKGSRIVELVDARNCVLHPDTFVSNPYRPLRWKLDSLYYSCHEGIYHLKGRQDGNFPIRWIALNTVDTLENLEFNEPSFYYSTGIGFFKIMQLIDAKQCVLNTPYKVLLDASDPGIPQIEFTKGMLQSVIADDLNFHWTLNGELLDSVRNTSWRPALSGTYQVHIRNKEGCERSSEPLEIMLDVITVFPNPVVHNFYVNVGQATRYPIHACLVDLTGRPIWKHKLDTGDNYFQMDDLPRGVYLLNFFTNDNHIQIQPQRIVKY